MTCCLFLLLQVLQGKEQQQQEEKQRTKTMKYSWQAVEKSEDRCLPLLLALPMVLTQ